MLYFGIKLLNNKKAEKENKENINIFKTLTIWQE